MKFTRIQLINLIKKEILRESGNDLSTRVHVMFLEFKKKLDVIDERWGKTDFNMNINDIHTAYEEFKRNYLLLKHQKDSSSFSPSKLYPPEVYMQTNLENYLKKNGVDPHNWKNYHIPDKDSDYKHVSEFENADLDKKHLALKILSMIEDHRDMDSVKSFYEEFKKMK